MLHAKLITVGLSDGAVRIRPLIPDMAVQIVNIVGFLLPDPQDFVRRTLQCGSAQCQNRKFLGEIIPVHHTEFLYGVRGRSVLPMRAHLLSLRTGSVVQNIPAHIDKNIVSLTHPVSFLVFPDFSVPVQTLTSEHLTSIYPICRTGK